MPTTPTAKKRRNNHKRKLKSNVEKKRQQGNVVPYKGQKRPYAKIVTLAGFRWMLAVL